MKIIACIIKISLLVYFCLQQTCQKFCARNKLKKFVLKCGKLHKQNSIGRYLQKTWYLHIGIYKKKTMKRS